MQQLNVAVFPCSGFNYWILLGTFVIYLLTYFNQHFIPVTKGPDKKNVEKEKFILTHGFS